jgi:hypothetical protein
VRTQSAITAILLCLLTLALFTAVLAQDDEDVAVMGMLSEGSAGDVAFKKPGYSPYAGRFFPTRVLLGDTHVHTGWSGDAGAFGCTLGPEEAVRFARGEEVLSARGERVKLSRPLDRVVISDHSDGMGAIDGMRNGDPEFLADPVTRRWSEMIRAGGQEGVPAAMELITAQSNDELFDTLWEAQVLLEQWRREYNAVRPHSALRYRPPAPEAWTRAVARTLTGALRPSRALENLYQGVVPL